MAATPIPKIIQGGMGAGVSAWPLARAVSQAGQLGVVAGTGLDIIFVRRLQLGDVGGHIRRALAHFPVPGVAERLLERFFVDGGKGDDESFRPNPMHTVEPSPLLLELLVAASFVEVFLAREGHDGVVGINLLEKIQLPTLPVLFGAMLAGVDVVLMGGGIPMSIPAVLDGLAAGTAVELRLHVDGALPDEVFPTRFDPVAFCGGEPPKLERPRFLAIVASTLLAKMLAKRIRDGLHGFVIEGSSAGGHNAPPRSRVGLDQSGEPVYGERDVPDLAVIQALGFPFWLAGSYATSERLVDALELGAAGVQVGTAFAFCEESGLTEAIKDDVLRRSRLGEARLFTDPHASPTGFPFKVVQLEGTLSDATTNDERRRICDLGQLRHAYRREDGRVGWRCPGEPVEDYVRKGGAVENTAGAKCLCNGLMANIGLGQVRADGTHEQPLVTAGDDVAGVARFLANGATSYRAVDVIATLLAR